MTTLTFRAASPRGKRSHHLHYKNYWEPPRPLTCPTAKHLYYRLSCASDSQLVGKEKPQSTVACCVCRSHLGFPHLLKHLSYAILQLGGSGLVKTSHRQEMEQNGGILST